MHMHMSEIDKLYYRAVRPREAVNEARAWLLDCFSDEDEVAEIRLLNSIGVVAAVHRIYEGGYEAFLLADGNLKTPA